MITLTPIDETTALLLQARREGRASATPRQPLPDAQAAYEWDAGWGRMRISLDWFNVTFSEEPIALNCTPEGEPAMEAKGPPTSCRQERTPPLVGPNLGLRIVL